VTPDPAPQQPPDGASAERTRLAWRRTMLAMTAVALLTIRLAVRDDVDGWTGDAWSGTAIGLTGIGWLAALWLSQRRIRAMAARKPAGIGRTLPAAALLMVAFALLGIALVVTGSSA
jgi:uncharacterized membrane protein YidH (DUF202 family)